ncbi:sensor histidine kinase [Ruminococcus sp.]|uniref:sensor histidine kinase n=1 Tax=Ruminococcus sp. TaxID=41978 RepID=UPI00388D28D3
MKPKKKLPLRVHLAIGFLIFSALLLTVLWLFQTVFLESFYKSIKTMQVKRCAYSLSDYLGSESFDELVSEIEEQNSMIVGVYDTGSPTFICTYSSSNQPGFHSDISMSSVYSLYQKAADNGGENATITQIHREDHFFKPDADKFIDAFDENNSTASDDERNRLREPSLERPFSENLAYSMIVNTAEGERLIIVESQITPVNSVVDTLRYQLIIMTAVIVVLSIVIAVMMGKMIARPISETNEKAKSLAKQDYDITFEGGRYREITELNATLTYAAGELKKVDSLQKELIANISHDLRTPLTMIIGYGEVMRDLPGEMTPDNIQIIVDEATRLNSLVTDLLDISRLQSNTADIKKAPFSLTKCIESIFARYTKLIENDGLNILFEHSGEVFVMGDELRVTQVLYNLINNAINYIGKDKTVIVRQTVQEERVRVEVIDHGEGIPDEKLAYIWDRYYRVNEEHRRAKIGTGLGLSIVKNILVAHDADFGVESTVGEGSDFWFSMPVIPTDGEE